MKRRNAWHLIVACGKFPVNCCCSCLNAAAAAAAAVNCIPQLELTRPIVKCIEAKPSQARPGHAKPPYEIHNLRPVEPGEPVVQLATYCGSSRLFFARCVASCCHCCCCCCFLPLMLCLLCRAAHHWQWVEWEGEGSKRKGTHSRLD